MLTVDELLKMKRKKPVKQDDNELRSLPYKQACIYGRVSSPNQVRDSHESIREIGRLVDLAKQDGFNTNLQADEIEKELLEHGGNGTSVWKNADVGVDVRDLGISGQLSAEKRLGLADLQRNIEKGLVGTIYLTEGVSRLSRDTDSIVPFVLLKLLRKYKCRIRTPEGVWNPAIDKDRAYIKDEFENAIDESGMMNRRLFRRKTQKARRGEFVGEPIIPGFILPIVTRKTNGQYEYGKMEPYPPHAEIVIIILQEYIRQGGICFRTNKALKGLAFPFFPPELSYMERLTSLRTCPKLESGYAITAALIHGLTTNMKLIGISQWGDGEPILNNHPPAVPEALFLECCQLAMERTKPKGRAVNFEPMEWSGLLKCMKHPEPRLISGHGSQGRYVCSRDYSAGNGPVCLDISKRYLDEPLKDAVLSQLLISAQGERVLMRMETEAKEGRLKDNKSKHEITRLEQDLAKWQSLLASCVDEITGAVNKEKETLYWDKIHSVQQQIDGLRTRQAISTGPGIPDFQMVREFMAGLQDSWPLYSSTLRNRFLQCLIDRVEIISGAQEIEATIFWKAGFQQKIVIQRRGIRKVQDKPWSETEINVLKKSYPSSSFDDVIAKLPGRSWHGIVNKAQRLHLQRDKQRRPAPTYRLWSAEDDAKLKLEYKNGMSVAIIASNLGRSVNAIQVRAAKMNLERDKSLIMQKRKDNNPVLFQELSP
jgi:hypothetical protein